MKYVLYCPETATYMYAHSEDERDILCADGLILDVTGELFHEEMALDALGQFDEGANEKAERKAFDDILEESSRGPVELMPGVTLVSGDAMFDMLTDMVSTENRSIGLETRRDPDPRFARAHYENDLKDE